VQARLDDPPELLPGIGPVTARRLAAEGVTRIADLLLHLPRRYEDRRSAVTVAEALRAEHAVLVSAEVRRLRSRRARRRMHIVEAELEDGGGRLAAIWFNQPWVAQRLEEGQKVLAYGQPRPGRGGRLQLVNPEIHRDEGEGSAAAVGGLVPRYPPLAGLGGARLRRVLEAARELAGSLEEPLPDDLRRRLGLPVLGAALAQLHAPTLADDDPERALRLTELAEGRSPAHRRLAFDELLAFALDVERDRRRRRGLGAPRCPVDDELRRLATEILPFRLTRAQRRVVREVARDMAGPHPMARLLQGDVGSGKTVVAALAMLLAVRSGYQAALMAPTEILAEQHHRTLEQLFAATGLAPTLLTASVAPGRARALRSSLAGGEVTVVVGTHALVQEAVDFERLGLVVVDEQHRFGANQRRALVSKGSAPHLLVMTATPIPRSLALTLYGDLDLSVIDELPPGRLPVRTEVRPASSRGRVLAFVGREIAEGGRALLIYPLIEASERVEATSLEEAVAEVHAGLPGVDLGVIHGRMPRAERESVFARFRAGDLQALLATTVVEVGVDVPEASVIVIESAERFGLSQLHQLRGRVGRGTRASWCVLLTRPDAGADARRRLELFAATRDGFELAEADLALRGPGELAGTRQWGATGFRFADLARDRDLVREARRVASELAARGGLEAARAALARFHRLGPEPPPG